ncbi:MAG: hypothetical protein R6V06_02080 [Kiritimatiellia bacterium]
MIFRRGFLVSGMCAAAMLLTVNAQDDQEVEGENNNNPDGQIAPQLDQDVQFAHLVRVVSIHGVCEVKNPDDGTFKPARHNKAYPLESVFRTGPNSSCFLIFSSENNAELGENTEASVTGRKKNRLTCDSLTLQLIAGTVKTTLRETLKNSTFNIKTPNADVKDLTGRAEYTLSFEDENELFEAATITGSSRIEGPHYTIPLLQAANTVNIMTSANRSFSRLTSVSGDFDIILPNGTKEPVTYGMSPNAIVKIWRETAPVGGRTIVSTLVISPTGMARHRFAYAEGRKALITGELVQKDEDLEIPDLPVLHSDKKKEEEEQKDTAL